MWTLTRKEIEEIQADPQFIRDMIMWQYECAKEELERLNALQYSGIAEIEAGSTVHRGEKENRA